MLKKSKIYVAGHRGLVGSAILRKLKEKGYKNIIVKSHQELDLLNQAAVDTFFKKYKPEYVFLAAAKVGGILANKEKPAEFIYENLMIAANVINAAYKYKVKKLLFLGSSCIYPRLAPQPIKEEYLLTSPLEKTNEAYAIAKIAGLKLCEFYNRQYKTNYISVMPTNLYGPNDNFDLEKSHVLPALIRKIHLGKCIEENNWDAVKADFNLRPVDGIDGSSSKENLITTLKKYGVEIQKEDNNKVSVEIWGSGNPLREFLWSEELADACVFIMENTNFSDVVKTGISEIRNTHINIGTGK